jgi:hypothetical protein
MVFFMIGMVLTCTSLSFVAIRILLNKDWRMKLIHAKWNLPLQAIGPTFSEVILKLGAGFILAAIAFILLFGTYLLIK